MQRTSGGAHGRAFRAERFLQLGVTLIYVPEEPQEIPSGLVLASTREGLELRLCDTTPGQGVRADLASVRSGRHPLGKALHGCEGPVVDATAGLGGDTAVLAALGRTVLAIERNDVLFAMLQDAHDRLEDRRYADEITLLHGDSVQLLANLRPPFLDPAAIVLDPMYAARRKASALPGKSMQLLRALVGEVDPEVEVDALLGAAFATRARRVVLKRPPEAPTPQSVYEPTFSIESKLVRWDVWERG